MIIFVTTSLVGKCSEGDVHTISMESDYKNQSTPKTKKKSYIVNFCTSLRPFIPFLRKLEGMDKEFEVRCRDKELCVRVWVCCLERRREMTNYETYSVEKPRSILTVFPTKTYDYKKFKLGLKSPFRPVFSTSSIHFMVKLHKSSLCNP